MEEPEEDNLLEEPKKMPQRTETATELSLSEDLDCCWCIGIDSGVVVIAWLGILLVLAYLTISILMFWNAYVVWWYPLVNFILVLGLGGVAIGLTLVFLLG